MQKVRLKNNFSSDDNCLFVLLVFKETHKSVSIWNFEALDFAIVECHQVEAKYLHNFCELEDKVIFTQCHVHHFGPKIKKIGPAIRILKKYLKIEKLLENLEFIDDPQCALSCVVILGLKNGLLVAVQFRYVKI